MQSCAHLAGAAVPSCAPRLTPRQAEILAFIDGHRRRIGYPPTVREIGRHFGIASPNGVICHLRSLRRKGVLTSEPGKSRTLRAVGGPTLPLLGEVR